MQQIEIPPCPRVLNDIIAEMHADDPDFQRVAGLISVDVGLAGATLKMVNSPFYGLRTRATSIQHACMVLGLRATALLVTSLLLRRAFPSEDGPLLARFWARSTRTATLIAWLAKELGVVDRDTAYTFGLFSDVGLPVMLKQFPDYEDLMDRCLRGDGRAAALEERARYATEHPVVGRTLATTWYLPEALCEAIEHHHAEARIATGALRVSTDQARLIALSSLATELVRSPVRAAPEAAAVERSFAAQQLGLTEADLERLGQEARSVRP